MTLKTVHLTPAVLGEISVRIFEPSFWFDKFKNAVETERSEDAAHAIEKLNRLGVMVFWDEEHTRWSPDTVYRTM